LECQEEDGAFPYGVSPVSTPGQRVFFSANVTAPFIAWECWNAYLWSGDREFLKDAYAACVRSHDYWLRTRDRTGEGLCCWLDFGETVRDDGTVPTWRDPEAPVMFQEALDLNCYLLNMQRVLREMAAELGDEEGVQRFGELWNQRTHTMNALLWNETEECYYGTSETTPDKFVRVRDISTLMPLWCGLSPADRAEKLIDYYWNPTLFQTEWPVPVLNASDDTYLGDGHWHGGNWIEMTWLVIQGLRNYGFYEESSRLAFRNVQMSFNEFKARSHLREYFDSATGAGLSLNDYIWAALPGYFIVESFYGVRPTREGIEIMPSLPADWRLITLQDLRIRGIPVALSVSRDPGADTATAQVNGQPWTEIRGNRGILIPWETLTDLPDGLTVSVTQPPDIQETLAPPFPLPENVLEPMEAPPRIQPTQEEIAFMENQHKNDRELRYSHAPMPVVKPPVRGE
jgi:glycogen debranching enzyme